MWPLKKNVTFSKKMPDSFGSFKKNDYLCTRNRENDERLQK